MSFLFRSAVLVALLSLLARQYLLSIPRVQLPSHLQLHAVEYKENFITEEQARPLRDMIRQFKSYPSNINADVKTLSVRVQHEEIGEGTPLTADGKCEHDFLVPNMDKSKCILPQRIDVGRHFVLAGGIDGTREGKRKMITRVSSFGKYFMGNVSIYPEVEKLFLSDRFQQAAKRTCPPSKQILDPFQFNIIIQVPGQTVALHIDAPYFWGATRAQFPQWLLAAMVFSNLFQDKFVDQVQMVGYLHEREYNASDGGDFVYYSDNSGKYYNVPSVPLSASSVDGSKLVHAANVYQPLADLAVLDKDDDNELVYIEGDRWELQANGVKLRDYSWNDLRISIVYRARCFATEEEVDRYPGELMELEDIIDRFRADLVKRGVVVRDGEGRDGYEDKKNRLQLAMLIMDTYIKYPLPSKEVAINPYNYGLMYDLLDYFKK